ncbi:hypothetical protein [Stenotrophomonas maltophilia]|uniref:hypothetical protein n=1 Tax=Stenotrophomonas maltophilia TaxID=40324 RepID=UPI0039C01F00
MDAIEKRARERARFDAWRKAAGCYSWHGFNRVEDMWDAWQAALTPPEGYVLVPVEPPVREIWSVIKGDGLASIDQIDGENPDSARHQHLGWLQLAWPELLRMLAARPEVKP